MHTFVNKALVAATGLGLAVAAPIAAASSAQALPAIMIYKVQYDSPGSDTGSNTSLNAEYVVIKNTTRSNRALTGWTLRDKTGYTYKFPTFTLKAGAIVTVHTGRGSAPRRHRYFGYTLVRLEQLRRHGIPQDRRRHDGGHLQLDELR